MTATRGPYKTIPPPALSEEQLGELQTLFSTVRKQIPCPLCHQTTTFHRAGTFPRDPTQPLFKCTSCNKRVTAYEMRAAISNNAHHYEEPFDSDIATDALEPSFHPAPINSDSQSVTNSTDDILRIVQQLRQQVENLSSELAQAKQEIQRLTTLNSNPSYFNNSLHPTYASPEDFPPISQVTNSQPSATPSSLPPWRNPMQVEHIKNSLLLTREKRRTQRQEAAARFFQPPSANQGFQYIYIPTKARIPVGKLRTTLRKLDINNSRILDIHYPDRNVAAILVHNDYATELRELLRKRQITMNDDFNPWDGSILKDPKYATLSVTERTAQAAVHQQERLAKALSHIRAPIKYAVARYFSDKHWISKELLDQTNAKRFTHPADIFHQVVTGTQETETTDHFDEDMDFGEIELPLSETSHEPTPHQ